MIDDHDQITVPALVGDLVDPDPAQALEPIDGRVDVRVDAGDDRADGAPRDPQQLHHRALRCAHRQPSRHIVEVASVARAVTCPRHRGNRHAVRAAPNSRRGRFEEHLRRAEIERTPPTSTLTQVVTR